MTCVGGLKAKYRDIGCEEGHPLLGRKFCVVDGKSIVRRDAYL